MVLELGLIVLAAFVEGRRDGAEEVLRRPLERRNDDGGENILEGRLQDRLQRQGQRLTHSVHDRLRLTHLGDRVPQRFVG